MGEAEPDHLGVLPSEKIRKALSANDLPGAMALCSELPEEYVGALTSQGNSVRVLADYAALLFRKEQDAISNRINESVLARDVDAALRLIDQKLERQYRPLHDACFDFKLGTYDQLLREFGAAHVYQCQRQVAEGQRAGYAKREESTVEDHLRASVGLLAVHLGRTTVVEDEEKYCVVLDPCGTGGEWARKGEYEPEGRHTRIAEPGPATWQRPSVATYCTHCAVWNEIAPIEWFGHPQWVFDSWREPQDVCRRSIYKDPNKIPADHWTMFGYQKPASLPKLKRGAPISREEMDSLGLTVSAKLRAALQSGNWEQASTLSGELAREYVPMIKGAALFIRLICDYVGDTFPKEQSTIAHQIRSALAERDLAKANTLLDRKQRQYQGVRDLNTAFAAAIFNWIVATFGDQALRDCQAHLTDETMRAAPSSQSPATT